MPRYYFDVRDGDAFAEDDEGLEFDGIEAAQNEATRALGELAKDALPGATRRVIAVEVRDEAKFPLLRAMLLVQVGPLT
jgi:hypothetical protein